MSAESTNYSSKISVKNLEYCQYYIDNQMQGNSTGTATNPAVIQRFLKRDAVPLLYLKDLEWGVLKVLVTANWKQRKFNEEREGMVNEERYAQGVQKVQPLFWQPGPFQWLCCFYASVV